MFAYAPHDYWDDSSRLAWSFIKLCQDSSKKFKQMYCRCQASSPIADGFAMFPTCFRMSYSMQQASVTLAYMLLSIDHKPLAPSSLEMSAADDVALSQ